MSHREEHIPRPEDTLTEMGSLGGRLTAVAGVVGLAALAGAVGLGVTRHQWASAGRSRIDSGSSRRKPPISGS